MGAPNLNDEENELAVVESSERESSGGSNMSEGMLERTELGKPDSLRYIVLSQVLEEKYERAVESLKDYQSKPSDFPDYNAKISRFISHGIDLVYAIKAKRNFPGMSSLTRSKQQELREKFREHLKELQLTLKRIEKINHDLHAQDVRSTIYVVKALWFAGTAIILLAFLLEMTRGMAGTAFVVADDLLDKVTFWLADILGL